MRLVGSIPFLLVQPSVSQTPCFVLQLPLQEEDTKSLPHQRRLLLVVVKAVVVVDPPHLDKCPARLVELVVIRTHTQVCLILDIPNMGNLLVILRGCPNSTVGQGSLCPPFLLVELGEVIQIHRKEEELLPLQAVRHLPVVMDQDRLQGHQLQVKCLVVCPDILVILTLLCTLTCIGNNSTWAHHTVNNSNNLFIHLDMLPEVLVKEDLEGLPDLTQINLQVVPLERQVSRLPKQRTGRMLDQKRGRSLPLKRVKERLQKKK
mmetsp:Transcript_16244/g.26667  ORF Transcript_16244/g.26667 Transcript_16244/m.26667 type:complete len:262 (+) Transcript_16244:693-1478(+)